MSSPPLSIDGVGRVALAVLATILVGIAVVRLRAILEPLILALFLGVVIDALARLISRWAPRLPRLAALVLAFLIAGAALTLVLYWASYNAQRFILQLAADRHRIESLMARVGPGLGLHSIPTVKDLLRALHIGRHLAGVARGLSGLMGQALLVLLYLVFLFGSRDGLERKARGLFGSDARRERAREVVTRIRTGMERYLRVQSLLALITAGASYALMLAVGLDDAGFWALLVFLAAFVPIIGGAVGIALPPLFALIQFDGVWQAVVLAAGAESIHIVIGNVVAPRLQGASLNIDPLVVVLSLAFWGLAWGPLGMFLSTPLTVTAIIVLSQFQSVRWIAVLLSGDGRTDTHEAAA